MSVFTDTPLKSAINSATNISYDACMCMVLCIILNSVPIFFIYDCKSKCSKFDHSKMPRVMYLPQPLTKAILNTASMFFYGLLELF